MAAIPARRRLLRAGLMGAPALLALKSTPVLACNCKLPSGFSSSGNLSRTGSKNCVASAPKPSSWCTTSQQTWYNSPASCYKYKSTSYKATPKNSSGTELGDLFCSAGFTAKYFTAAHSFDTVLKRGDKDIGALICAAYLESFTSGGSQFPNGTIIKAMWNSGVCGAGYTTGGVVWKEAQVLKYLLYVTGQA